MYIYDRFYACFQTAFYQKEDFEKKDESEGEIDAEALNCLEGFMVVDSVGDDEEEGNLATTLYTASNRG